MTQNQTAALAALGRILIVFLFFVSGAAKVAAPSMIQSYIASAGLPAPFVAWLIAIIIEVGGGILLVVGYQTRIVAAIMAIYSIAAASAFHHNFSDQSELISFLKDISIAGGLLQVAAFGAGAWSLDARRELVTV